MGENKREKFVRLAEDRTNKVIKAIQVLSNCANPGAYEYSDRDVEKIFNALEKELKIARQKFSTGQSSSSVFKL